MDQLDDGENFDEMKRSVISNFFKGEMKFSLSLRKISSNDIQELLQNGQSEYCVEQSLRRFNITERMMSFQPYPFRCDER